MFPYYNPEFAIGITLVDPRSMPCNDVSHKLVRLVLLAIYKMLTDIVVCVLLWVACEHILHKLKQSLVCFEWLHGWFAGDLPHLQESPFHFSETRCTRVQCSHQQRAWMGALVVLHHLQFGCSFFFNLSIYLYKLCYNNALSSHRTKKSSINFYQQNSFSPQKSSHCMLLFFGAHSK